MKSVPAVVLADGLRARLAAAARAALPEEACGILLATRDGAVLVDVHPARNAAGERAGERFVLDPRDHLAAELVATARGLSIGAFWHSHPGRSARPSEADRRAAWPGSVHVVVGLEPGREPELRAWRLEAGRFREAPLCG
ncbi:MAG: M67 family metallopeptidase [Planctomycetes bacterium]|nr:M67 family metallopeptidase [Planctomycetota bacterium]